MARSQSFIRTVWNQVTAALQVVVQQLRIRDIAFRWTPSLLNKTPISSATIRPPTSTLVPNLGKGAFDARLRTGCNGTSPRAARGSTREASNLPVSSEARVLRALPSLMKMIFPRTAPGVGLWVKGTFSPGKPSTLVVGGSPALGPDTSPRLALLA